MITVTPDPFTLIAYDAAEIRGLVEEAAALVGIPPGVDIHVEVDEELFAPLVGHMSDVVDGALRVWISGANFEDTRHPRHFARDQAQRDLTVALLRGHDRLSDAFADAPPDAELTRAERTAWDAYAVGRAHRLGMGVRQPPHRYEFRLQHGFSDAADAAFDRLWAADSMTFAGIREICAETGAVERQKTSKVPIDLLRRK